MTGLRYLFRIAGSGLRAPKACVRGTDVAGRVEAVGKDVTQFQSGGEVFGICDGAFAEYTTARPDKVAPKPSIGSAPLAESMKLDAIAFDIPSQPGSTRGRRRMAARRAASRAPSPAPPTCKNRTHAEVL
jgi:hypothetical protein